MKKLLLSILILITTVNYAQAKTDEELVRRTEEWFKSNPNSMPHWMTPEELERLDEIGKNFIQTEPPVGPVRQTAEFERMQSVLIRYPFGIPLDFIKQMSLASDITTIVADQTQKNAVINTYISAGIDTSKCDFLMTYTESYWTRDYGPWYVVNGDDEVGICDFIYNRPRPGDDAVPSAMAPYLGEPYYGMSVIHTGGNYMTDGMGIGASSDIVYTESLSSLGISPEEVDQRMNDYLGVHTYHAVPDPNNTYIDHIDCWGKFLDVDKILIREVPTWHAQYSAIEATASYFASQKSSYGNNYQVYRVNTPNNEPYSNSLILNDHVFVPILGTSNDAAALSVYQNAMPGYTITGVLNGTGSPWESTDALHCRTRGVADKEMLHIYHVAKVFDQPSSNGTEISAKIVSYGGHSVTTAELFYKVNSESWISIPMSFSGDSYSATIPSQSYGALVSYYIHSEDSSGRIENHPFIGSADPHTFSISAVPDINLSQTDTLRILASPNSSVNSSFNIENTGDANLDYDMSFYFPQAEELLLHSNDFESGIGYGISGDLIWNATAGDSWNSYTTCAKLSSSGGASNETGILTSDIFDGTNCTHIYMDFDQSAVLSTSSVSVEYFNGSTWELIYTSASTTAQHVRTVLPVISSTMQVRFTGNLLRRSGDSWSIDDILITGSEDEGWLIFNSPFSGSVVPASYDQIALTFNTTSLSLGDHYADITIYSNDADADEDKIILPVKLTVTDVLSAPSNLIVVNATASQVDLGWDAVSGASLYRIYRSTEPYTGFAEIGTSGTETYTDSNVSSGNKYFYYITSGNGK